VNDLAVPQLWGALTTSMSPDSIVARNHELLAGASGFIAVGNRRHVAAAFRRGDVALIEYLAKRGDSVLTYCVWTWSASKP
jgi:hypothetical protein